MTAIRTARRREASGCSMKIGHFNPFLVIGPAAYPRFYFDEEPDEDESEPDDPEPEDESDGDGGGAPIAWT